MSFQELLAELPSLTVEQRQLLMRRILELEDPGIAPTVERSVEDRRAAYPGDPSTALPIKQIVRGLRQLSRAQGAELRQRLLLEAVTRPATGRPAAWKR